MSLSGPLFLDGIISLTVAAFFGLVVMWPRLTSRTPWHIAGRMGALALVNVLVLLTVVTQPNSAYLFFAGWGDPQGAITGHIVQTGLDRGGAAMKAPNPTVRGDAAMVASHVPALTESVGATGLLLNIVDGGLSGLSGTVLVQLPTGYGHTAASAQRYAVLEALHGYPNEPLNWVKIFGIRQAIDQLVQAHALRPTLVVMPQIEMPEGVDTEGVNGGPGQPQVETWLTRDVPDWVAQRFWVEANRNAWAPIGYSAGGFDAALSTILHPAQYGAGVVLGGYLRPELGPFYEPFSATSPAGRRYDLPRVVAHPPPVALWVEISHADQVSYTSSARFPAVHEIAVGGARGGPTERRGHRDSVWTALLPQARRWLGTNIDEFHPGACQYTHSERRAQEVLDEHGIDDG